MKKQMNRRAAVLSLAMAAMLALPTMASAQGSRSAHGGLFGTDEQANKTGMLNANSDRGSGQLTNETFGDDNVGGTGSNDIVTPLGSGVAILLLAGAGYVALKKKED